MKKLKIILLVLLILPFSVSARSLKAKVLSVHDGDTLTLVTTKDSKRHKVRLMGVDTPETEFFNFTQGAPAELSRQALVALLPAGSDVEISDQSQTDKFGRLLAVIIKDGQDINKEMLRQGWGFMYFIYPFEKSLAQEYSQAAYEGIATQSGLFSANRKPTEEPYLFRIRVRHQVGRNPVGDLETKKIYAPEDIQQIPLWRRVFFSDLDSALTLGYQ